MDEETTAGLGEARARLDELIARLKDLLGQSEETMAWFAMWMPVIGAAGRLATTFGRVGLQLKAVATGGAGPVWTEEDRAHVAAELASIAADFPDVAEVIFGLQHIDSMIDALMADEGARKAASKTLEAITSLVDGLITRLIDIAIGERQTDVGPDRVVEFIDRFEDSIETLLNPWVQRALGVSMSEANIEATEQEE